MHVRGFTVVTLIAVSAGIVLNTMWSVQTHGSRTHTDGRTVLYYQDPMIPSTGQTGLVLRPTAACSLKPYTSRLLAINCPPPLRTISVHACTSARRSSNSWA